MMKWWKRRWLRAQSLAVLQNFYELPLREPLEGLDDLTIQQSVDLAVANGGNEWDAAAGYVYLVATGIVGSMNEIRGEDRQSVTRAAHITNTYGRMNNAASVRPLVRDLIQRWNAHPDHPSNRVEPVN